MNELDESNRQFIDAWSVYARRAASGEVTDLGGVAVAYSRVTMPLMNMMFLSSPVADRADLERRTAAACAYAEKAGFPWMITLCDDWIPADVPAAEILAKLGLAAGSAATGMATDALATPRRPAPPADILRVTGREGRIALADINTAAYGMPLEWGHEALDRKEIFADDFYAYVAYVDGKAVSTSTTALVDGRLYVMLVATAADEQGKGYAEAVMRRSLEEAAAATGIQRTTLHATEMGAPLYLSMGYHPTGRFTMYAQGGHE